MREVLKLEINANLIIKEQSIDCIIRFMAIFDQIQSGTRKMNDFLSKLENHENYTPEKEIEQFIERRQ